MNRKYNFSTGSADLAFMSVHKVLFGEAHPALELYRARDKSDRHANVDASVDCMSDFERRWG